MFCFWSKMGIKSGERLLVWEILHNFVLLYNCKVR